MITSKFQLHKRLAQDCIQLGRFELSLLLLMNDINYPWFILVPQRADITEIFDLSFSDQKQLAIESVLLSETLARVFKAHKMNTAAIGNLVPQLHIHHIVRYQNDRAWPAPIWGAFDPVPYTEIQLTTLINKLKPALPQCHFAI